MNIECTHADGYTLVRCEGSLTKLTHEPFQETVYPLFEGEGEKVVIDLSDAEWINSEGIAALVRLAKEAGTRGGRVVFAAPTSFVDQVLRKMRLNQFLDIAATREEAVAKLLSSEA